MRGLGVDYVDAHAAFALLALANFFCDIVPCVECSYDLEAAAGADNLAKNFSRDVLQVDHSLAHSCEGRRRQYGAYKSPKPVEDELRCLPGLECVHGLK